MMLLAVMASPCAPTVPVLLPSCILLPPHLSFVQLTDALESPTQILTLCSRATLAGTASFSILLKQQLVPLEPFLPARSSSLISYMLILTILFLLSSGGLLGTSILSSKFPQINFEQNLVSYIFNCTCFGTFQQDL